MSKIFRDHFAMRTVITSIAVIGLASLAHAGVLTLNATVVGQYSGTLTSGGSLTESGAATLSSFLNAQIISFPIFVNTPHGPLQTGVGYSISRFNMEFSLNQLPTDAAVTLAMLSWKESSDGGTLTNGPLLRGYAGDGFVSTADFHDGTLLSSTVANSVRGESTIDVTTFINDLLIADDDYAGFYVGEGNSYLPLPFYSIYGNSPQEIPTLTIAYIPEVLSGQMLGTVFLLLILFVWIRRYSRFSVRVNADR